MASGGQKRTRSERVAALELSPGQWERAWINLRRRDVLGRIGLALLAAVIMAGVIRAWNPPFAYRTGYVPARNIVASIAFTHRDAEEARLARQLAKSRVPYVYVHDPEPLRQLIDDFDDEDVAEGALPDVGKEDLAQLRKDLGAALDPFIARGLLDRLPVTPEGGNQKYIHVQPLGQPDAMETVGVDDVLIGNLIGDRSALRERLDEHFQSSAVAKQVFDWLVPRLMPTLRLKDAESMARALEEAAAKAADGEQQYVPGQFMVSKGQPLREDHEISLLLSEYRESLAQRTLGQRLARAGAVVVMIFLAFVLCGVYMRYRQRGPLASKMQLSMLLALAVIAAALAAWSPASPWRFEVMPVLLFGMTMAIAYRQELALLLAGVLALILAFATGHGLHEFVLLVAVTATAILSMGRIRSRSKLIYVGLFAGLVAVLLEVSLGVLVDNQPLGWDHWQLLAAAGWSGLWGVAAGFVMTGLLPFVEKLFGVLTDLSLLELGDVAHPLLQELIRRAPSTYNHSVTVGSIAEAAADSIGARGLLCRVGAYFHDIGKMLKPGYYIENQGSAESRHASLVPAMSSLVIVAHIKDGSDLARQHRLPQPIIDLIQQHHGTTMVGFFYERATQQKQADPNGGAVDESTYRYPGPRPQTKEAAVLMLADSVESASRTLVDPTPKRIERLARELAERRLHGGQFDESGLTLRELRTIERSMVKSLISIYHGRLKYPDQRTA